MSEIEREPDSVRAGQREARRDAQEGEAEFVAVSSPGLPAALKDLRDLFHRLTNVVPDDQQIESIPPEMPAGEALDLMKERGFSQFPIMRGNVVLGSFSFRSFALGASGFEPNVPLRDVPVDEFRENLDAVHPTEELTAVFDALDRDDAVLVGDVEDLRGLVTPMDVLRYLHRVAEPYVQLGEIERSLREVMTRSITPDEIEQCAHTALRDQYENRLDQLPTTPDAMTLGDLVSVIRHGKNYGNFAPILGAQRALVTPRLNPLPELRNVVLHYRRDLADEERAQIGEARSWLLSKLWGRA